LLKLKIKPVRCVWTRTTI